VRNRLESTERTRIAHDRGITRISFGFTLAAGTLLVAEAAGILTEHLQAGNHALAVEQLVFLAIAGVVLYGNLVYQVTRLGFLTRRLWHRPTPRTVLERVYDDARAPALLVLVPSYKEDASVVRKTLLSAALQEYPNRRIALLIDDPPEPADAESAAGLAAVRRLPREIAELLEKPARHYAGALEEFERRASAGALDLGWETRQLAALCAHAAAWFDTEANIHPATDHADRAFVEVVFERLARGQHVRMRRLEEMLARGRACDVAAVRREHRRLAALFRVEITSFERKRYANLSHEPNKAMNLNGYIALLGRSLREVARADGIHLEPAEGGGARIRVPDAEYLLTLDADSVLAPDYALRLVHRMRRPENERVAVAQTPYSAFPGAPGALERLAGATTDIQYLIHQGFTRHGATYWVGANALLRTRALREIQTLRRERGYEVEVFIQDRTVIEDTESSVDLIARGWALYNYPERLAWSATPPDFGALVIQRRRWANGGLLILAKLLRHLARSGLGPAKLAEGWLRFHYLTSIAAVNVALLALLYWPFDHALRSPWFPLAAIPYFALYGRDLVLRGYSWGDLVRVYALNLLLVPVNLAGVGRSLLQGLTGRKTPFARTPKVPGRTPAPAFHHLAHGAILVSLAGVFVRDLALGLWVHASFVATNGLLLSWAVFRLVGLREAGENVRLSYRLRREEGSLSGAVVVVRVGER
jgi:cellulose synthase (UDP-forming)